MKRLLCLLSLGMALGVAGNAPGQGPGGPGSGGRGGFGPTPPMAANAAAAIQVSRTGASDERMSASPASLRSFQGEYFVTPAMRAWRSYQTGSWRNPAQGTRLRR